MFTSFIKKVQKVLVISFALFSITSLPLYARSSSFTKTTFNKKVAVKDTGAKRYPLRSVEKFLPEMGVGWNLGHSLDAIGSNDLESEVSWGQPKVTQELFKSIAASGIKTVRIPVSWHNHIIDQKYTIDPNWMRRVKEVVDWAIKEDLIVILNVQNDISNVLPVPKCGGYYPNVNNKLESEKFLVNVWAQIALAFNNGYDKHLIFELLSAPRLVGTESEYNFTSKKTDFLSSLIVLKELEEKCLVTIRNSGGNNGWRFVMIPSYASSYQTAFLNMFSMPKDDLPGRIILSLHFYEPQDFAVNPTGERSFTQEYQQQIKNTFYTIKKDAEQNDIPVVISECGAINKNNLEDRISFYKCLFTYAKETNIPCVLWDNGVPFADEAEDFTKRFGLFNRTDYSWYFTDLIESILALP